MSASDFLLEMLGAGRFRAVEDAWVELFRSGKLREPRERARCAIVVAQARALGPLDARGAMVALLAALNDPGWRALSPIDLARANVVSTIAVTAPGRDLEVPAALARVLSRAGPALGRAMDPDLRALAAVAMLGGGVDLPDAGRVERFGGEVANDLDGAVAPVTRCLALEVRAAQREPSSRRLAERGVRLARRIGFDAADARLSIALGESTPDPIERARAFESATAAIRRGGIAAAWLKDRARAAG